MKFSHSTGSFMAFIYSISATIVLLNSLCQKLDQSDRLDIIRNALQLKENILEVLEVGQKLILSALGSN